MKIVFMGSPDFAIPSLEKLMASPHEIAAVVSNPDKRRGRGSETSPTAVKARAMKAGLPVISVDDLSSDIFADELEKLEADLFVVVAFRILPKRILEIPTKGSINLHASLLPKYRGAAPIHWAVINGEEKTGCTVFFLDEKVDTGSIIKQGETPIGPNETTGDLYGRLKEMGSKLLLDAVDEIEYGSYSLSPQDDSKATPAPKLFTEDCRIDFDGQAQNIHNKIRGLSPFPTAWAELDDLKFNMYRSSVGDTERYKPGQIGLHDGQMMVGTKDKDLILQEVQIQGKRRMSGRDFMNGYSGTGIIH
ncbi:methionyl-tRNA formyltransferase [Balneolaceae bacterium YR4-1]|uniref:Methionyl-tRNA formyltransferase n=1 Tax=Halalkalibaculum roseum TaxID=2709311 RepID=A0A6M1SK55_9BACT|nr:methionyl-tRNA formyltransferase [Halalkalibaculum roseum]NGP75681.1 methionyl-tRNA formyltransferase [Halalkalibaculum roseum]